MYLSLTNGSFDLSARDVVRTLLRMDANRDYDLVVFEFRLPRILLGALVGFGLGIAGAVLQGLTRNALADPGILGIHAAAGASGVLGMFLFHGTLRGLGWMETMSMPVFGWAGGIAAIGLLLLFARQRGELDPQRLVLVGIALGSGFGAFTLYLSLKMNPRDFEMATVWLAGSLYNATWKQVAATLPWVLLLPPLVWRQSRVLDLFQLQEISVRGLGVRVERERRMLLLGCVGLVSACVAVSGSIGFVGLVAPHMAKRLVGLRHARILPVCGTIGALLVVAGDLIGRTVFAPAQLPVGIVISIIGVPYFVYLLYRSRKW